MNDNAQANRFAPPGAAVTDIAVDGPELASRGARFGAALIDGMVALAFSIAVMLPLYGTGYFRMMGTSKLSVAPGLALYVLLFYALEGWFLYQRSQSIGKIALGLRIVRTDGSLATIGRTLGIRLVGFGALGFIPLVGPFIGFIDALFIFGSSRRCLHDLAADTIVVTAVSSQQAVRAA
jgi:uncharacterized RDD family membrane protein YckC